MRIPFRDRAAAGRLLAGRLEDYRGRHDTVVMGLPRGGVAVAYEVARTLGLPLDVYLVRKLGVPGQDELAMGAIASGGTRVLNRQLIADIGLSQAQVDEVAGREASELQRRERAYRGDRPRWDLADRIVVVVDDGLATGATMRAAVLAIREQRPRRLIVAVPVGPIDTCRWLGEDADDVICLATPSPFLAVGAWYEEFQPVSDVEVRSLLARSASEQPER